MVKRIAIVEDEFFMREELQHILVKEGYDTFCITKFSNAVEEIIAASPELVLLDLNLPGISGFEICKGLKQKSNILILVLTGRDKMKDELHALNIGADEYINKPCHKEILLARIKNLIRRLDDGANFATIKDLKLDLQTYAISNKGKSIILPENQGKIMELLIKNYPNIVSKKILTNKLWGTTEYIDENALHVNMTRLKKSLNNLATNYKINTIRGKGYSLEPLGDKSND